MEEKICKICGGSGWVRKSAAKEWHEEGFGKLIPCECKPKEKKELKQPKDRSQANIDWIHK